MYKGPVYFRKKNVVFDLKLNLKAVAISLKNQKS